MVAALQKAPAQIGFTDCLDQRLVDRRPDTRAPDGRHPIGRLFRERLKTVTLSMAIFVAAWSL